ncbi:MAG: hypothetical protein ACRD8U_08625 [Pyrinomonadaceae bacterium]
MSNEEFERQVLIRLDTAVGQQSSGWVIILIPIGMNSDLQWELAYGLLVALREPAAA